MKIAVGIILLFLLLLKPDTAYGAEVVCTDLPSEINTDTAYTYTATGLTENQWYNVEILPSLANPIRQQAKKDSNGVVKVVFSLTLRAQGSTANNATITLTSPSSPLPGKIVEGQNCVGQAVKVIVPERPVETGACCENGYEFNNSTRECIKYGNPLPDDPLGARPVVDRKPGNCKEGEICQNNICHTIPNVKWYSCDTPYRACIEYSEPGAYNNRTTNRTDCDNNCLTNGKTFGSNPTAAPTPCYRGTPTPGVQRCTESGGSLCDPNPSDPEGWKNGIQTAIGCVPTEPKAFIMGLLTFSTRIGGGLALLLMIAGAFQMITSNGNPDTVKKGQEQFTHAIIGLLFIIFSVLILKIIGYDILQLPGFSP